ncbi:hypothetical protein F4808DRAFT_430166 [Astrocystis sublimbata]|nr:hypothetical protein F4808DRAFT_430166 [Astrocystis sublimbata]
MTQPTLRKSPLEIPLNSKPRDYRPGDGPALAPIHLALKNDTSAIIVDKRVLPGEPVNGELKLELYYTVSWSDLPAARVCVLATKILDYVSPRTLEDWEYKCSLERDEEQAKLKAAQKRKQGERDQPHASLTPMAGTSISGSNTPGQKKRGRPSKAEVQAREIAQQTNIEDDELANMPLPSQSTSGPSLSTPKKSLANAVTQLADVDMEDADAEGAISKQLQGGSESVSDSASPIDQDMAEADELSVIGVPQPAKQPAKHMAMTSLSSFLPANPSREYADFSVHNPPSSTQPSPTQRAYPSPISSMRPLSEKKIQRRKTKKLTTSVPVPTPLEQWKKRQAPGSIHQTITPVPAPSIPVSLPPRRTRSEVNPSKNVGSAQGITPIPAPSSRESFLPPRRPRSEVNSPKQTSKSSYTPIPVPSYPAAKPRVPRIPTGPKESLIPPPPQHPPPSKKPRTVTHTPIPPPPVPSVLLQRSAVSQDWRGLGNAEAMTRNGVGRDNQRDNQPQTPSKKAAPSATKASTRKRKQAELEEEPMEEREEGLEESGEEPSWEVERLEGDKVVEEGDEPIRYFKVRWVGKWPRGQNPTWEPEELISEDLVREYLVNKAVKMLHKSPRPFLSKAPKPTPTLKTKYSSVAEAFEGDEEYLPGPDEQGEEEADDKEGGDDEEVFQITEQKSQTRSPPRRFRIDSSLVAELAANFSPRERGPW